MTVIVVGSGPSGLAAAWSLVRAGVRVRLLEAAPKVGGKMQSVAREGFVLDEGAFLFPTTHRVLLSIAEEAGIASKVEPGGFVLGTERAGQIHELDGDHLGRDILTSKVVSTRAKLRALRLAPDAVRARRATFERMPECGRYDGETLTAYAGRVLDPEGAEFLLNTAMRAMFNTSHGSLTRVDLLGIISLFAGAKLVAFRGGMGTFSQSVASVCDVQTRAEVIAVSERRDDVRVTWRDEKGTEHTEQADGCVLATPAAVSLGILEGLDVWRREYMGRVRNGRSFCMSVALERPPAGIRAVYVMVPPSSHDFVVGLGLDHNKARHRVPEGKGLITIATKSEWCDAHADDDDDTIAGQLLDGLHTLIPAVSGTVEFVQLHRWHQEFNPVGHYRGLGRLRAMCAADRRVQLAGDYHSSQSLNSAASAGAHAARNLLNANVIASRL